MPLFQGIELRIQSGDAGTSMYTAERLQSASFSFDLPRAQVKSLNSFRPDTRMPVIGYAPVNLSFDMVMAGKFAESALGLLNPTGVICGLTNARTNVGGGVRNFEIFQSPLESTTYLGQFNIQSGVLNSYNVSVNVGDTAKKSFSFSALDIGFAAHTNSKTGQDLNSTVIRHQDVTMTEAFITGLGITGFSPQSISIGLNISRVEVNEISRKFPTDRPMTDAVANIQLQGFIERGNTSLTGLGSYDCGMPITGVMDITLTPPCGGGGAINYRIINPYLQSMSLSDSVGSFNSVDMNFTIPLPINAIETGRANASNLIIS